MGKALFLPARLAARGASVRLVSGWETRTAKSTLAPAYLICHHTASVPWSSAASNLSVCVNGNSVAPGPISQTLAQRDGSIDVVAAGSANHAGAGAYPDGTSGNGRSYGIEAVNSGIMFTWNPATAKATWGGNSYTLTTAANTFMKERADRREIVQTSVTGNWYEPWGEKLLLGYAANVLAYLDETGWGLSRVLSHQVYAPTRKIDPAGPWFDNPTTNLNAAQWMARFKELIVHIDQPTPPPQPTPAPAAIIAAAAQGATQMDFYWVGRKANKNDPTRWLWNGMVLRRPRDEDEAAQAQVCFKIGNTLAEPLWWTDEQIGSFLLANKA